MYEKWWSSEILQGKVGLLQPGWSIRRIAPSSHAFSVSPELYRREAKSYVVHRDRVPRIPATIVHKAAARMTLNR